MLSVLGTPRPLPHICAPHPGYQIPIPLVNIGGTNEKGRKLSATLMTQSLNHVPVASSKLAEWYRRLTQSIKNQGQFEQGF